MTRLLPLILLLAAAPARAQEFAALLSTGPIPYLQGPALVLARGPLTAGDGAAITWGDYDADGRGDLLLGSAHGDLLYYRGLPSGFAAPVVMLAADVPFARAARGGGQVSPELADLLGDGVPDLLLGAGQEVYLYLRTATGMQPGLPLTVGAGLPLSRLLPGTHLAPTVADFDGDGDRDLLLGDDLGRVWWVERLPGAGLQFAEPLLLAAGGAPLQVGPRVRVAVGDWDRDGSYDLVLGEASGRITWARGRPDGLLAPRPLFDASPPPDWPPLRDACPRLAELDGEGGPELLVGGRDGFVAAFSWTPQGPRFTGLLQASEVPLDVGRAACPTLVDWNADGRRDLLVGAEDGKVRLFLARADGRFAPGEEIRTADGPLTAAPGTASGRYSWPRCPDLNGDGAADLLLGGASGQVAAYLNQGGLRAAGVVRIGGAPIQARGISTLEFTDYDGDGDGDLFVGDLAPPLELPPAASSEAPRFVLNTGGISYYENEAPKGGGMPVFLKGVRLTLYLGRTDRAQEGAALDAAVLGPYYLEPAFLRGNTWEYLVGTREGYFLFPSLRDRQYYPTPVLPAPRGELPPPPFPPLYSATVAALRAGPAGLLCGLADYGFVCYYPPDQVPQVNDSLH